MKRISLLLVLFCVSLVTLAQNQVATLQHNDSITGVYYGAEALLQAYLAADNGDVITLSSGTFNPPAYFNSDKSITVHGAGCAFDTVTNVLPTIITDNVKVQGDNYTFEGIHFSGKIDFGDYSPFGRSNHKYIKCYINEYDNHGGTNLYSFEFCNCIVKQFHLNHLNGLSIINSVMKCVGYYHYDIYNPTNIYNSVILFDSAVTINNIVSYNSIIATESGHELSNNYFFNCIGIKRGETSLFEDQLNTSNMTVNDYSDVFETFDGNITFDNIYQLNSSIATSFLGHDGTEVGIYGGMMPYKTRPSYMIMKSTHVAGQTDQNKKLNIEMELLGPED